ncbi:HNH endonuclease [Stenotrophomonas sp. BIGb0135]|uniref:HNH endonuclease n=1 Tax=Stenotrophomonas sp. BIGb0135 TaxID=2940620 RepID=UPI0021687E3E|nr:HNH endonuclease [Stenotrophomonas sp. BIGb0135]MCS4233865.1 hypothetical protein [Stenotrophomonas sp. BIGb0135]
MTISIDTVHADIEALRPTSKRKIIDVVKEAGQNVEDWASSTTGNPDTNPKYCYEWYFEQGDNQPLLCLWFESLQSDALGVFQSYSLWPTIKSMESQKNHAGAKRADRLDNGLQRAFAKKIPVRVALVAGRMRAGSEGDSSKADYRELDHAEWMVTDFNHTDGTFTIRRGVKFDKGATQAVSAPAPLADPVDDWRTNSVVEDLEDLAQREISQTTRAALVDARLGQGAFRTALMRHWEEQCAASGCTVLSILRASHILPWRDANDEERLDPENGLLLTANLDALFDRGLITFDESGHLITSSILAPESAAQLLPPKGLRRRPSERQRRYLQLHRETVFQA